MTVSLRSDMRDPSLSFSHPQNQRRSPLAQRTSLDRTVQGSSTENKVDILRFFLQKLIAKCPSVPEEDNPSSFCIALLLHYHHPHMAPLSLPVLFFFFPP